MIKEIVLNSVVRVQIMEIFLVMMEILITEMDVIKTVK